MPSSRDERTPNRGSPPAAEPSLETETVDASRYLGRAIWRNLNGYHRRRPVETKMHCVKLLGQSLMARDFDRQVAEIQVRIAVPSRYNARRIPATDALGNARLEMSEARTSPELCNKAPLHGLLTAWCLGQPEIVTDDRCFGRKCFLVEALRRPSLENVN